MLEPHEVQPGALDENRDPLKLIREGGEPITVVDRFQAGRGSYLIVADPDGNLSLLHEATAMEEFEREYAPNPSEEENDRLRERIAELEAQQQTPATPATEPGADTVPRDDEA